MKQPRNGTMPADPGLSPPGFLALVLYRPPWPSLVLLGLALLLAQAPDPTGPEPTGQSLRVLALPMLAAAMAAAVPTVLRALSQRRALAARAWRKARVSRVEVLTSGDALPRNRILWADADGRTGRSRVITKPWVPPEGASIRVVQDPATGRQWWEGDIPGTPPTDPGGAQVPATAPRRAVVLSWPATWVAIMAGLCAVPIGLSDAPGVLLAPPVLALILGLLRLLQRWQALSRALRLGPQILGKVTAHHPAPVISVGHISTRGPRGAAMRWETRQGHFGLTDYVSQDRLVAVGQPIPLRVDPVTGIAFWDGG